MLHFIFEFWLVGNAQVLWKCISVSLAVIILQAELERRFEVVFALIWVVSEQKLRYLCSVLHFYWDVSQWNHVKFNFRNMGHMRNIFDHTILNFICNLVIWPLFNDCVSTNKGFYDWWLNTFRRLNRWVLRIVYIMNFRLKWNILSCLLEFSNFYLILK